MKLIKNYDDLSITPQRETILKLIEKGLEAIQPRNVLSKSFSLKKNTLYIKEQSFNLDEFTRIICIGFGKGSGGIVKIIEETLAERLTYGYDIDVVSESFAKINFTLGTHPQLSQTNLDFTKNVLENTKNLTPKDLVLVVICGGGSALFEFPKQIDLETLEKIGKALIHSGATISEINTVRKHLSLVKGGGLAKHLYPAKVVSMIFSDVVGNDLSVIASGPTVKDPTTQSDVKNILQKYQLTDLVKLAENDFVETPTQGKYFINVNNILMLNNNTALSAMKEKAQDLGFKVSIYSDRFQGDAKKIGKEFISAVKPGRILLLGGESTVHVTGKGNGGRNQTLVLASLPFVGDLTTIASFDSDGWDYYGFAGAIGDYETVNKARNLGIDPLAFLEHDNSYEFFKKTGDGIDTGKLPSNVSDLMIIMQK